MILTGSCLTNGFSSNFINKLSLSDTYIVVAEDLRETDQSDSFYNKNSNNNNNNQNKNQNKNKTKKKALPSPSVVASIAKTGLTNTNKMKSLYSAIIKILLSPLIGCPIAIVPRHIIEDLIGK